jgi:hypothetical protein
MSNQATPSDKPRLPIPMDWLVGLATAPILVGLACSKLAQTVLQDAGQLSEEIFRGDRLPPLPFPKANSENRSKTD